MKRLASVLLLAIVLGAACPIADQEAVAFMLPPSCIFAEELGWEYWGWNAMCRKDLERYSAGIGG